MSATVGLFFCVWVFLCHECTGSGQLGIKIIKHYRCLFPMKYMPSVGWATTIRKWRSNYIPPCVAAFLHKLLGQSATVSSKQHPVHYSRVWLFTTTVSFVSQKEKAYRRENPVHDGIQAFVAAKDLPMRFFSMCVFAMRVQ